MKRFAIIAAAAAGLVLLNLSIARRPQARAQAPDKDKLAAQVKVILEKHCEKCHGQTKLKGTFDVRDARTLFGKDNKGRFYVSQGGKEDGIKASYLWARIESDDMPQDSDPVPDADKAVLKSWLEAGAPAWKEEKGAREFVGQETVLRSIYNDLKAADEEDRPYRRYFTFANLHNDPTVTDDQLARFKAGLSKAFNSMHWKKPIVILEALKGETKKDDPQHTVFAFDLRDVDWDRKSHEKQDRWSVLLNHYPYGVRYDDTRSETLAKLDRDLFGTDKKGDAGMANGELVYIRADWFLSCATRPPVYEKILRLPPHVGDLERELGVDPAKNFRRNRVARAGFTRSGVSEQHRLIERHDAKYGAYWKSYDFKKGTSEGNLLKFPLGPVFRHEYNGKFPYEAVAFKHDGGEMIFNLPNGLQGYYLAKGDDTYLEVGPIDVVQDGLRTSGTPEIVNGLSCINCHVKGMIEKDDQIRAGIGIGGEVRRKVNRIYVSNEKMNEYYKTDAELFQTAARKAMRPFMKSDSELETVWSRESEPIGALARRYIQDLSVERVAFELGYGKDEIEKFKALLDASEKLRELGLATLVNKGSVKREDWGEFQGRSLQQRTMFELNRGRPWRKR